MKIAAAAGPGEGFLPSGKPWTAPAKVGFVDGMKMRLGQHRRLRHADAATLGDASLNAWKAGDARDGSLLQGSFLRQATLAQGSQALAIGMHNALTGHTKDALAPLELAYAAGAQFTLAPLHALAHTYLRTGQPELAVMTLDTVDAEKVPNRRVLASLLNELGNAYALRATRTQAGPDFFSARQLACLAYGEALRVDGNDATAAQNLRVIQAAPFEAQYGNVGTYLPVLRLEHSTPLKAALLSGLESEEYYTTMMPLPTTTFINGAVQASVTLVPIESRRDANSEAIEKLTCVL